MAGTIKSRKPWFQLSKNPALKHTGVYQLHLQAKATIGSTEAKKSVKLPPGVCKEEWILAQVLNIFEEVCQVVCLLEDVCTETGCPCMSAGKHFSYDWADERHPQKRELSAPVYMSTLLQYAEEKLSDPRMVPTFDSPPPGNFMPTMQILLKRFFRVFAHAYIHHFEPICASGAEGHINFCFKHFLAFVREFGLVSKDEMAPLRSLIEMFDKQDAQKEARADSQSKEPHAGEGAKVYNEDAAPSVKAPWISKGSGVPDEGILLESESLGMAKNNAKGVDKAIRRQPVA